LNPNPKWPEGYLAVLREVGAQKKTIPLSLLLPISNWHTVQARDASKFG
jgi:hypothetical protein